MEAAVRKTQNALNAAEIEVQFSTKKIYLYTMKGGTQLLIYFLDSLINIML